ncbi:restriction endonuclease subunit S [Bacteroides acidifaciens]|uniref:restriction endonuclease subunit S n=2 Tax=Bacteroides acidifaciens TaxID=85831 RepID=UPI0026764BA9|nr:restriction endonuclease subunit S [Bacteroides acidifaciens]
MAELSDVKWKEFSLTEIFPIIKRGKRLKKSDHLSGVIPYVSSTATTNGVDGFIGNQGRVRVFNNCLTVANSGSVGSTFYHSYQFIASDHVTQLKREGLDKYAYLFLAPLVQRLSEKYSFNREINDDRLKREKLIIPVNEHGEMDFEFMSKYMREIEIRTLKPIIDKLCIRLIHNEISGGGNSIHPNWKPFPLSEIFTILPGKRLTKSDMTEGLRPFIGASDSNNGVTAWVNNTNESLDSNVLGVNYNGSVCETFFHPYECIFSDDVKRLHLKSGVDSKYIMLFLKTIILQQKCKYEYGYKFNEQRMLRQTILLPVDSSGNPDWHFMEMFMRKLETQMLETTIEIFKNRINVNKCKWGGKMEADFS